MDLDVMELFGEREAEVINDSGSEDADNDDDDDDGGQNNPDEEAIEVPAPGAGGGKTQEAIKPKRIIKNPRPKFDVQRLMGPRGVPALQRTFKDVKWAGKGREREDLRELLRHLQHWGHRLYPAMPFSDTLAQIEKLGSKKNVKVHIKKLRLDMFVMESDGDGGEDNVRRWGDDEEQQQEEVNDPVVDVFDELLGTSGAAGEPTVFTPVPSQRIGMLTAEQKEQLERNRRLAAERRMRRQQEEEDKAREEALHQTETMEQDWSPEELFDTLKQVGNVREQHVDADRDKRSLQNLETVESLDTTLTTNHNTELQDTGVKDIDKPANDTSPSRNHDTTSTLNSMLQDTEMRDVNMDSTDVLASTNDNTSIKSHITDLNSSSVSDSQAKNNSTVTVTLPEVCTGVVAAEVDEGAMSSLLLAQVEPGTSGVEDESVACTLVNTDNSQQHTAMTRGESDMVNQKSNDSQQNSKVMNKKSRNDPTSLSENANKLHNSCESGKLSSNNISQSESVTQDLITDSCSQQKDDQIGSRAIHSVNGPNLCQSEERESQMQDGEVVEDLCTEDLMKMLED
ncbi:hypothetical protein Pmani_001849 [Petrolisthes manimaculis]|uniref:TIMELESS-interacting protein n=1 Tax=Petrolisthes manimaculis TaxID=1843537 RepID=A0AAE1QJT7_9EUCA|nr:hypothetical protein Pmani_001849 [Petrolisthes manimaculis]